MTVLGVLGLGRGIAASRFTETLTVFTVDRVLGADGVYAETEVPMHADVAGQVKFPSLTVAEREQGAQVPAVQDLVIKVAVGATPNVVVNTLWRVTASQVDPSLVGRVFRTKGLPQAGQVTAHRYPVEQVT